MEFYDFHTFHILGIMAIFLWFSWEFTNQNGGSNSPNDELIFFRGLGTPPTRIKWVLLGNSMIFQPPFQECLLTTVSKPHNAPCPIWVHGDTEISIEKIKCSDWGLYPSCQKSCRGSLSPSPWLVRCISTFAVASVKTLIFGEVTFPGVSQSLFRGFFAGKPNKNWMVKTHGCPINFRSKLSIEGC